MLTEPTAVQLLAGLTFLFVALSLGVALCCTLLHRRLSRSATAHGMTREFAALGGQIDHLAARFTRMESNIDWLAEERMIEQAITIARSDERTADPTPCARTRRVPRRVPH